jgi:hypothetical protein
MGNGMRREAKKSFLVQEQFVSETHDEQQDFKKAGDETHAASVLATGMEAPFFPDDLTHALVGRQ